MKAVKGEEVMLRVEGFVKEMGFKPRPKEREGIMDEQSGETKEEEVIGED